MLIWDDNEISIEDDTKIAKSEDVAARYAAYGWHVQHVDWRDGDADGGYHEDAEALYAAIQAAKAETDRPSFIALRTIIGWPAPNKQNTGKIHGSALGADEVAATKQILGFDPDQTFAGRRRGARARPRGGRARPRRARASGSTASTPGRAANPERKALFDRHGHAGRCRPAGPTRCRSSRPTPRASPPARRPARCSTRSRRCCPSCGAARPTWPRATTPRWRASRRSSRRSTPTKAFPGDWYGRTLHFGIREHGMGAILNGIVLHGGTRPYGGTFLVFSDYMRPAVRLAALMKLPVDLRVDARLDRPRRGRPDPPADRAPDRAAGHPRPRRGPPGRRQRDRLGLAAGAGAHRPADRAVPDPAEPADARPRRGTPAPRASPRAATSLAEASDGQPQVILIGTGSEVQLCLAARERLEAEGTPTRVVSMPCQEWFRRAGRGVPAARCCRRR